MNSLNINFVSGQRYNYPLRGKQELLARAMGLHLGYKIVWDCTAGLGEDAWTLCRLGFQVLAVERNPIVFDQLRAAHQSAKLIGGENLEAAKVAERLELVLAEAESLLRDSIGDSKVQIPEKFSQPEVIYLDPMFPVAGKTALPRKEMQILRGMDLGAESVVELLGLALARATQRVVLKRGLKDPLVLANPQAQIRGKSVRFDIYFPKARR